jgi:hypothetical protein
MPKLGRKIGRNRSENKLHIKGLNVPPASPAVAPGHLTCLSKLPSTLLTADGKQVELWYLAVPSGEDQVSAWARAFRQHYCSDSEIDVLRNGTGLSRSQYLTELIFPDKTKAPGPSIRAGDFAELLVADYIEFVLGYYVPRGKFADKASRDESVKGVDILGFKMQSGSTASPADALLAFEVKAQLTGPTCTGRLQVAVDHSSKDYIRQATTLNATKRRLYRAGEKTQVLVVERFQNPIDHPYKYQSGAAAMLSGGAYDATSIQSTTTAGHQNSVNLQLIVIRGSDLMALVHLLDEKAANEA